MSKAVKIFLVISAALILFMGSFSGGFVSAMVLKQTNNLPFLKTDTPNPVQPELPQSTSETKSKSDLQVLFQPFWRTWDLVHEIFVDQPVNDVALMQGAIRGMLESLGDEHTSYIDPELLKQESMQLEGEYEGIGAWVDLTGEFLTITSPMPGSPAEKAGLKPGDRVTAINGEDMTGKDGNYVLSKILGPAGTEVTLTILSEEASETFEVTITRSKIEVPSVESEILEGNIGYVRISTFGDKTGPELKKTLKELRDKDIVGLVVDLRFNGGGLLSSAVEVGSQFLKSGVLMYEEYGTGEMKELRIRPGGLATEIPLVVLVNKGTASASEIVAGAIQDMNRGKLIGETTYGKGSVQNWIEFSEGEGAVRITVARWLTTNKRQINKVGLTPDILVEITEENYVPGTDPQLEKAIAEIQLLINQ